MAFSLCPVNSGEKPPVLALPSALFCLDVARMLRANTNDYLDEYEQDVDEIVAACNGDLRGAVKALMLVNEQLEQKLGRISAELVEHLDQHHPRQKLLN